LKSLGISGPETLWVAIVLIFELRRAGEEGQDLLGFRLGDFAYDAPAAKKKKKGKRGRGTGPHCLLLWGRL